MTERCYLVDRVAGRLLRITLRGGRFAWADARCDGRWRRADLAGFYAWLYRDDVEELPEAEALALTLNPVATSA